MEVTVRKIKATKSVIQQTLAASLVDLAHHKEVLGFCILPASGKTHSMRMILLYNKEGLLRKFRKPVSVEVKSFDRGLELIVSYPGVASKGIRMANRWEADLICERIKEVIKKAEEAGQFYY